MPERVKKSITSSITATMMTAVCAITCGAPVLAQDSHPLQSGQAGQQDYFKHSTAVASAALPKIVGDGSGELAACDTNQRAVGSCPLRHTSVNVHVSGYIASVDVKQSFHNPFKTKIEAVYKFPLSDSAAVDDMTMKVGDRLIHGTIKKREEAREIYEEARNEGYTASLLDQQRPNVFTQSVANIEPGKDIDVTIHYVDLLPFENGAYSFVFPTVVGPRFNPDGGNGASGALGGASQPEQAQAGVARAGVAGRGARQSLVTESSMRTSGAHSGTNEAVRNAGPESTFVNPLYAKEGTRSGHDLSISLDIDAGMPVQTLSSALHAISVHPFSPSQAHIDLVNQATIPNKDFVLSWTVAGDQIKSGYLTHRTGKSGFVTVMLVPPKRVTAENVAPKEMLFLIDRSGSQSGAPLDKAKETMLYILDHMNANDTFQIMSFANDTEVLFDKPQRATRFMKSQAVKYISLLTAEGGTFVAPAVQKLCSVPEDSHRLRIVTFMTDGYFGNDEQILGLVHKCRGTSRWFSFGTGNSVNRFVIDGIAKEGGGDADYILLDSPGAQIAQHFYNKISSPVLTDVHVDFDGVGVQDVFPRQISDVWADKPLYIKARYAKGGKGVVHLRGFAGGKPYEQDLAITLPDVESSHPEIAPIWARAAVDELMSLDWFGAQNGNFDAKLKEDVTTLALRFHIMTQFTSFVAVDYSKKTQGHELITTEVPVDMPEGVSLAGLFREQDASISDRLRQQVISEGNGPIRIFNGGLIDYVAPAPSNSSASISSSSISSSLSSSSSSSPASTSSATSQNAFANSPFADLQWGGGWTGLVDWLCGSARDANLFGGRVSSQEFISSPAASSAKLVPPPPAVTLSTQAAVPMPHASPAPTNKYISFISAPRSKRVRRIRHHARQASLSSGFSNRGAVRGALMPAPKASFGYGGAQSGSAGSPGIAFNAPILQSAPSYSGRVGGGVVADAFQSAGSGTQAYQPQYNTGSQTQSSAASNYSLGMPVGQSNAIAGNAPALQGATNGTIGPQGTDATYVTGVNTAGVVRVNNLANFEAFLKILAVVLNLASVAVGIIALVRGIIGAVRKRKGAPKSMVLAVLWLAVWYFFCLALVPWTLWFALSTYKQNRGGSAVSTAVPTVPANQCP